MTKKFVIFVLMLMAAVGMQAQSLIGSWKTVMTEDGEKMDMYFIFKQSTFTIKGTISQTDPEVGTFTASLLLPGTYTRSGNTLNLKTNPEQVDFHLDKMDFNDEVTKALNEMPEMKKTINEMVEKSLSEGKAELAKSLAIEGEVTIESLTATELILVEDDQRITFTRVR